MSLFSSSAGRGGRTWQDVTAQLARHGFASVSDFAEQNGYRPMRVWNVINGLSGADPDSDTHTIYQHLASLVGQHKLENWRSKGKTTAKRKRQSPEFRLVEQLKPALAFHNTTLAKLAEKHGWSYGLVVQVSVGRSQGSRGESREIREKLLDLIASSQKKSAHPSDPLSIIRHAAACRSITTREYLRRHGFEYQATLLAIRKRSASLELYGRLCAFMEKEHGYTMPEPPWVKHGGHRLLHRAATRGLYPGDMAERAGCSRYYVTTLFDRKIAAPEKGKVSLALIEILSAALGEPVEQLAGQLKGGA